MWHRGWKRSAGQPGETCPCVCFVRPQPINSQLFSPRLDKPIKFMSSIFFQGEKGGGFGVFLLLGTASFLPSPGAFSTREQTVPLEPYGSQHPPPLFPALITHYPDLTNPLLAMFCVIFLSARLSRCCDCKIQSVGLLKAERETGTRREKLWAHLQRNKTFRSHKQTSTCSISAFVLFVNN